MYINPNNYPWQTITENGDTNLLDFSVNTNFLGVPDAVRENISVIADVSGIYPDPECKRLTACLAEKYNVPATQILCGNGADDLLYRLVFAIRPKHAIVIEPAYEEYQRALKLAECEVLHYTLNAEDDFELDDRILSMIQPDCDMLLLCNPNNPTGQIVSRTLIKRILERCVKNNVIFVVDECFMEFLPQWREYSAKNLTMQYANLVVIDAFTKTYCLAGFRLGFCFCGDNDLRTGMRLYGQSFSVSTLAQFAGLCALMDSSYMQETYRTLLIEREWVFTQLEKFSLKVFPSQGNFLLVRSAIENIRQVLLEKGIKVRDCSKFYGLSSAYCRIAIRKHSDNKKLMKAVSDIFL